MNAILQIAENAVVNISNDVRFFVVGSMDIMPGSVLNIEQGSTVRLSGSTANLFDGDATISGAGEFVLGLDGAIGIGPASTLIVNCDSGLLVRDSRALIQADAATNGKMQVKKLIIESGTCKFKLILTWLDFVFFKREKKWISFQFCFRNAKLFFCLFANTSSGHFWRQRCC